MVVLVVGFGRILVIYGLNWFFLVMILWLVFGFKFKVCFCCGVVKSFLVICRVSLFGVIELLRLVCCGVGLLVLLVIKCFR